MAADSRVFFKHGRIDWIPDYLLDPLEPWLVDDLSSLQICLIGALAHVDAIFCDRLRKELASYHSPVSVGQPSFGDYLFETTFSAASIEHHFRRLEGDQMRDLLSLLCRTGSCTMLRLFTDFGVDVNGVGPRYNNMLGDAASVGNMDMVYMLLGAGANSSLAIHNFLQKSWHLSDALFGSIVELLVENARPALFHDAYCDPLLSIIKSSRALCSYPKAPEVLLGRKIFTQECFGEGVSKAIYDCSYMFEAILRGNSSLVDLLLHNGARADTRISQSFDCDGNWFGECTWTTFSVECSTASCTDVLIQHGADITALDGAGRSAIQLASNNALGPHPRYVEFRRRGITAEEDAETLAVVERAFHLKFQSLDDFLDLSNEIALQPPSRRENSVAVLRKTFEKALGIILTPSQIELLLDRLQTLYQDTRKIWSLSFHEALLMRCFYVISYALLLAYELNALIKGRKRIPMPSRFLLSALALLALALIWGPLQGVLPWGFIHH